MGSANYVLIESDAALDSSATPVSTSTGVQATLFGAEGFSGSQQFVRRPARGLQLKREVFAVLSVPGVSIKNSAAQPGVSVGFTSNFLLQSVQESRQEKFQPISTFGAPYGFFFGEQPRMVTCQAVLLNTADFQWEAEWWENYDQYLRGTRLVDRGTRVTLTYEDVMLEGYMVQASTSKGEPNPWAVNLTFTLWVTGVTYLIDVGATHVDSFHSPSGRSNPSEFDEFDSDGTLEQPTMLEEVRARNIKALSDAGGTGLVGALRSAVESFNDFTDKVGSKIDSALDWLYGRNMVIPAGFAGSERVAGSAVFAEGAGAVLLTTTGGKLTVASGSVTVRAPVRVAAVVAAKGDFYDDNIDEYPARYASVVKFAPTAVSETADPSIAFAENMFKNFGIDGSNDTGQKQSDALRALGTATFAAISYAASGASAQDAAALLATASSADFVSASVEQATAEALV